MPSRRRPPARRRRRAASPRLRFQPRSRAAREQAAHTRGAGARWARELQRRG